jgi:hypothetical protein
MGQFYLYDMLWGMEESIRTFDLDDVDNAFKNNKNFPDNHRLNYHQKLTLEGKAKGITVTPFPAGHLLGGTIWKISKEQDDIIYAVNFNHKRERHLNGCMLDTFKRPTLLIMDAFQVMDRIACSSSPRPRFPVVRLCASALSTAFPLSLSTIYLFLFLTTISIQYIGPSSTP